MILNNFHELIGLAKGKGRRKVVVPNAADSLVIGGIKLGKEADLVEPILIGSGSEIEKKLAEAGLSPDECRIIDFSGDEMACTFQAIEMIRQGEADLLMKGRQSTGSLLKAVLNKENGLRGNHGLSHMAMVEVPGYPKLFGFTDGGINLHPSFDEKKMIVSNALELFRKLGYAEPKIGLLAYYEGVNPKDPETADWATITQMGRNGEFGKGRIFGPLALDLCLSRKYCEIKGFTDDQDVSGNVDAIVASTITACNATTKGLYLFANATACGIIIGATAPIVMLSRADPPFARLCSLALGIASLST